MRRRRTQFVEELSPLCFLVLACFVIQSNALSVSPQKTRATSTSHHPITPSKLNELIQSPHIGYIYDDSKSLEVFVIGTSHFKCNSTNEVKTLIEQVQPDGVVVELDPERVLRLTKQYSGIDQHGKQHSDKADYLMYGADFVAAVDTCQQLDIPLFLGDEYAQETKQRLAQQLFNVKAYSPAPLLLSLFPNTKENDGHTRSRINLLQTFMKDPQKLTPLIVTSSPPFLLASALAFFDGNAVADDGTVGETMHQMTTSNSVEVAFSILASFFASCLLFNTVIVERDSILAASTRRASKVLRSLKEQTSIRKRWKFTVNGKDENTDTMQQEQGNAANIPIFTLKTPLMNGAIRNLNLFEPRWLKMIDSISSPTDDTAPQFGCVRCTNKFYSAISMSGAEGRYVDVIFEQKATLARIVDLKEGKRPVSGDRRIVVRIQGGESFDVNSANLSVTKDGYMVASNTNPKQTTESDSVSDKNGTHSVRMVVVVGLLHGNGIVELLSENN